MKLTPVIRPEFSVHMLNDRGKERATTIAEQFSVFLSLLETVCGSSGPREMAIVRTKLEEAAFFAKRAMAVDPENQQR